MTNENHEPIEVHSSSELIHRNTSQEEPQMEEDNISEEKKAEGSGSTFEGKSFVVPTCIHSVSTLSNPKSWGIIEYITLSLVLVHFFVGFLPLPQWFFVALFLFYRACYNLGIGFILFHQSKSQSFTKFCISLTRNNETLHNFWKAFLKKNMGSDYCFENTPDSYNAWITFRVVVDWILMLDVVTYVVFCLRFFEVPETMTFSIALEYFAGVFLILFGLWSKIDAHRVIGDYAWYWGDFFWRLETTLTFDGVFEYIPHPMYSVGYVFFYGVSLITQSYTVLYISLLAHFAQMLFLAKVENPHIEKIYGGEAKPARQPELTKYFRRDLIVFRNFDPFRAPDLFMAAFIAYNIVFFFMDLPLVFYVIQAVAWRVFHTGGLGYILHRQSQSNWWVRHFEENGFTLSHALESWKSLYNTSLTVTTISFVVMALSRLMRPEQGWFAPYFLFLCTIGGLLLWLNVWTSTSVFEVLGEFGWFYGDFFIPKVSSGVKYTGIYRFFNNPESTLGFAGYYGVAIISQDWVVFAFALFSHSMHLLFVQYVEMPHMRKLYRVRNEIALERDIKQKFKIAAARAWNQFPPKLQTTAVAVKQHLQVFTQGGSQRLRSLSSTSSISTSDSDFSTEDNDN
eukprot:GCRY01001877.1.p1 GENE.GCRY01001877.1~~GCRY01001877.1.p1  ORF type:complete len:624 (+),score=122.42 GCRY01001877.1:185-2056(+)